MRRYLETIHEKPEAHKKRFALLVSGCFTLLIFGIWFVARQPTTDNKQPTTGYNHEFSPIQSLKASVSATAKIFFNDFEKIEQGLETVHKEYDR